MAQTPCTQRRIKKVPKRAKKWFVMALGWFLVAVGVVGLFLPVLQGLLFIGLGAGLLSRESPTAKRWLQRIRKRFHVKRGNHTGRRKRS